MLGSLASLMDSVKPKTLEEYFSSVSLYQKTYELNKNQKYRWFVMDARSGYIIFKDENVEDRESIPKFLNWISNKNEAIEYCVDYARKEIEELKIKV